MEPLKYNETIGINPGILPIEAWENSDMEDKYVFIGEFIKFFVGGANLYYGNNRNKKLTNKTCHAFLLRYKNNLTRIPAGFKLEELSLGEAAAYALGTSIMVGGILKGLLNPVEKTKVTEEGKDGTPNQATFEVKCPKCNDPAIPDNDAIVCEKCGVVKI